MPVKKEPPKNKPALKPGDKVWWYHPEALWTVINVNPTHAHLRNIHGVLEWIPLDQLHRVD